MNSQTEVIAYGSIGLLGLAKLSGFSLVTSVSLPIVSVGAIGLGSIYGIYRIVTKNSRYMKEEKNKIEQMFIGAGIKNKKDEVPTLVNIYKGEYEDIYSFIKPNGFSTVDFKNKEITIREYFSTDNVEFESNGDFINIRVTTATLPTFIPFQMPKPQKDVVVSLGRDIKGNDVQLNLNKNPNVLISGMTGSGKSVCTNTIVTQLYCNYKDVEIYLIDMKSVELNIYKDLKQTKEYTNKLEGARKIVKELLDECNRRNDLFNRYKVKELSEYNKKVSPKDRLNPIVCIIEEAVRLMADKDLNKDLAELGFICRSCSISIITNIQRPTAKLFNPDLKASLTNVIGFRTTNRKNSEVITDTTLLATLRGKGNGMLFNEDVDRIEFQGYYLDEKDIEKLLKKYCE